MCLSRGSLGSPPPMPLAVLTWAAGSVSRGLSSSCWCHLCLLTCRGGERGRGGQGELWALAGPSGIVPFAFAQPWAEEPSPHGRAGALQGSQHSRALWCVLEARHKERGFGGEESAAEGACPLPSPELPSNICMVGCTSLVFLFLIKEGDASLVACVVCSLLTLMGWHDCAVLGALPGPGHSRGGTDQFIRDTCGAGGSSSSCTG